MKETVTIIHPSTFDTDTLKQILNSALEQYNNRFSLASITLSNESFHGKRNQYNAQKILYEIYELKKLEGWNKCIAITCDDIFIDGTTFVFGLASPTGGICIVSLNRLIEHQIPTEEEKERIAKEITHEIGHVYGLRHCTKNCVMAFSSSIPDIDSKSSELCRTCKSNIIV